MATSKPNPYKTDEENPEWSAEEFKKARPAGEVLHEIFSKEVADEMLNKKPGRPMGSDVKESQTVRFDRDIIGKGWQTRMNEALREWLKEHPMKRV